MLYASEHYLATLESGLEDGKVGRVDADGDAGDVGLRGHQVAEPVHARHLLVRQKYIIIIMDLH